MTPASKNPQVISTLVFVFLAGAVVGALSMQLGLHEKLHRTVSAASAPQAHAAAPTPVTAAGSYVLLQKFKSELNLTPGQSNEVAAVLDEYRHYYQSLEDQLDDVRSTGKNRILQVLNAEQRQKFEKMVVELQPGLAPK